MAQCELLVSPPGTGKTSYCIDLFKKEILRSRSGIESRSFFILPSREHADRIQSLILRKDIPGLFNVHILTINDLASRLLGISAVPSPSDPLRKSIIRMILEEEVPVLSYFEGVKNFKGFHELLTDVIQEFKAGLLTTADFEKRSQTLLKDPVFRAKFRDFSIVLKKYEARLSALGLGEVEDGLGRVLEEIAGSPAPDLVIFDGFYHFTRAQKTLIEAVSRWSARTVVSLTISNEDGKRGPLFEYPERTKDFLLGISFKVHGGSFKTCVRTADPALLHLEKHLFADAPKPYQKPQSSVTLIQGPNTRVEVEMIAREIKKIYRESAVHWSDICLILRELGGYEKMIVSVFRDFGIPVTVHERKKLIENGFVKVLNRFLDLSAKNWRRDDLIFILRSVYWSEKLTLADTQAFEFAALRENVTEGRDAWQKFAEDPALPPPARAALEDLLRTEGSLNGAETAEGYRSALLSWIASWDRGRDRLDADGPDTQAFESVEIILRSFGNYYGRSSGRDFSALYFTRELQDALEAGLFSVKPSGKNLVQVYDVVMALPKEYKVVFIPGLLEKAFPKQSMEDPIFKDRERRVLNRKDAVLEERLQRISGERYFFYMAVTRAKEKLYLSYPEYEGAGQRTLASFFIEETAKCFKGGLPASRKTAAELVPPAEEWARDREVLRGLAEVLRVSGLPGLFSEWSARGDMKSVLEYARSDENALLKDPEVLSAFKKMDNIFSATKLETFATCPFKHFADRILRLVDPLAAHEPREMGTILHETLDGFYKGLSEEERWTGSFLDETEAAEAKLFHLLETAMSESSLNREPVYRQKMFLGSMKHTLSLFVRTEKKLRDDRELVPSFFELGFGDPKENDLPYLEIKDEKTTLRIEGKIDRVDIEKGTKRALIIDYKRSKRKLSVHKRFDRGLEFQLPIYLLAARELLAVEALGAELRILKDAFAKEGLYRESAKSVLGLSSNSKTYEDPEFEGILETVRKRILANVERLRKGDISVRSKSCEYCDFSPVCRFEPWRLIYSEGDEV